MPDLAKELQALQESALDEELTSLQSAARGTPGPQSTIFSPETRERAQSVRGGIRRGALATAQGFNRRAATGLGFVADLVTSQLRKLGIDAPEITPEILEEGQRLGLIDVVEPENLIERSLETGGEVLFDTAVALLPILRGMRSPTTVPPAPRVSPPTQPGVRGLPGRVVEGARRLPRAVRSGFTEPFERAPLVQSARELGVAIPAGAGEQVAEELLPGSPTARLAGSLVGAGAGAALGAPIEAATVATRQAIRGPEVELPLLRAFAERRASERFGEAFAEGSEGALGSIQAGRERLEAARELAPGFRTGTSAATGERGLLTMQADLSRRSPSFQVALRELQAEGNEALFRAFMNTAPPAGREDVVRSTVRVQVDKRMQILDQQLQNAKAELDATLQQIGARTGPEAQAARADAAQAAVQRLDTLAGEAQESIRQKYRSVGKTADQLGARFDSQPFKAELDALVKSTPIADRRLLPRDIINDVQDLPERVPWREIEAFDRRLNAEIRAARVNPERQQELVFLLRTKDVVEAELLRSADTVPEVAAAYRAAKDEVVRTKERFSGSRADRFLAPSRRPIAEEAALDLFFRPGPIGRDGMEELLRVAGGDPEVLAQVDSYVTNLAFELSSDASGTIQPDRLARFLRSHKAALDEIPDTRDRIATVEKLQRRVDDRFGRQQRAQQVVERSALRLALGDDPRLAAERMLNTRNPETEGRLILSAIGKDEEALQGFRNALIQELGSRLQGKSREFDLADNPLLNGAQLRALLESKKKTLAMFFPASHIRRLRELSFLMDDVKKGAPASVTRGRAGEGPFEGVRIRPILTRFYGQLGKLSVARTAIQQVGSNLARAEIEAILERALSDPDFARLLMSRSRGAEADRAIRLFVLGVPFRSQERED